MLRILVVEDTSELVSVWKRQIASKKFEARIVWAASVQRAEEEFTQNPDFDAIIMDCCVPGNQPTTLNLTKMIRQRGFTNPIIAKSSHPDYCNMLLEAGASHVAVNGNVVLALLNALES